MKKVLVTIVIEEYEHTEDDPIARVTEPSVGIKIKYREKHIGYPFICSDDDPMDAVPELVRECIEAVRKQ